MVERGYQVFVDNNDDDADTEKDEGNGHAAAEDDYGNDGDDGKEDNRWCW